MASRPAVAVTAALLIVVQVTSAFVVPEVVLMRVKRNPDPMRSFSFSGFDPNGQMAAFTGMSGYSMFGGNGYGPPPRAGPYHYGPPGQDSYGQSTQDSYGPPPSGAAAEHQQQPAAAADPNAPKVQQIAARPVPADSSEQQSNSVEQVDATRKQHKGRDGPSSNAEASFNAWFPIMFGVFPNGAGYGQSGGNTAGRFGGGGNGNGNGNGNGYQGQGGANQDQGPGTSSYGPGNGFERSSGTTVIANSVSNGRNGVATSHAIAYGNPRSSQQK